MADLETLKKLEIRDLDEDLRSLDEARLRELFASKRSGRVKLSPLMRNIIWQAHGQIIEGAEELVEGNLRTFWYSRVKPVLSKLTDDDDLKSDPYYRMLESFRAMALDHGLVKYADFGFTDEGWEGRRIGTERPEVLVFTEKMGWIRFLRRVHGDLGVSTLALGGAPSALTSEYTATHMLEAMGEEPPEVHLVGIVDWDPAGAIIAAAFQEQLRLTGLTKTRLSTVVRPALYTADEMELYKFPLPNTGSEKTKAEQWLAETGGVNGEAFGLEAESLPMARARAVVEKLVLRG